MIKLYALIAIVSLVGLSQASSDCVVGKYTTCKCPNGYIERHLSNSDALAKAMLDNTSCCYPHRVMITSVLKFSYPKQYKEFTMEELYGTPKVEEELIENISNTIMYEAKEVVMYEAPITLFESGSQPRPQIPAQISNALVWLFPYLSSIVY